VGAFWIRSGIALELKGRFDCARIPPPTARHKVAF